MGKMEILGNVGSMQQLAFVGPVVFTEGKGANLPAYTVKNGPISFNEESIPRLMEERKISLILVTKGAA
jgi:hypothetical protein